MMMMMVLEAEAITIDIIIIEQYSLIFTDTYKSWRVLYQTI